MLLSAARGAQADTQPPADLPPPLNRGTAIEAPASPPASYQAALAAMQAQDWPRARQLLQQTLDEHPAFAGAWLDLALVAWQQGEGAEAREFLDDLEEHFAPLPPAIAQAAQTLRQRLASATPAAQTPAPAATAQAHPGLSATDTAGYLALGLGHDSNANVGLRADAIRLTMPGGQVELPLAASSRERSAAFGYAALQQAGAGAWQTQPLAWNWSVQTRQPSGIHGYSTVEAQGELGTPWASSNAQGAAAQSPLVGLRWHSAWIGGQLAYVAPGLYASQRWASASPLDTDTPPTCQWQQRAQLESRNYPRARNLASWGATYRLEWDCASSTGLSTASAASGWIGQAEASWDAPRQHTRPGGHTWHTSLQLGRRIGNPWGLPGHQLSLSAEWAHTQDTAGYSPWLEAGARRIVHRLGWQAHWLLPPAHSTAGPAAWRWALQLQGYRQSSNIPLFSLRSTAVQLLALHPW